MNKSDPPWAKAMVVVFIYGLSIHSFINFNIAQPIQCDSFAMQA